MCVALTYNHHAGHNVWHNPCPAGRDFARAKEGEQMAMGSIAATVRGMADRERLMDIRGWLLGWGNFQEVGLWEGAAIPMPRQGALEAR